MQVLFAKTKRFSRVPLKQGLRAYFKEIEGLLRKNANDVRAEALAALGIGIGIGIGIGKGKEVKIGRRIGMSRYEVGTFILLPLAVKWCPCICSQKSQCILQNPQYGCWYFLDNEPRVVKFCEAVVLFNLTVQLVINLHRKAQRFFRINLNIQLVISICIANRKVGGSTSLLCYSNIL